MSYISRIVSLKDWGKVLYGRDLGNALDEGIVYGVQKVMGVITLIPIGEAVVPDKRWKLSSIIGNGKHCLTKDEYRSQLIKEDFLDEKEIEGAVNGTSGDDGI